MSAYEESKIRNWRYARSLSSWCKQYKAYLRASVEVVKDALGDEFWALARSLSEHEKVVVKKLDDLKNEHKNVAKSLVRMKKDHRSRLRQAGGIKYDRWLQSREKYVPDRIVSDAIAEEAHQFSSGNV
jgi:hypothetical protein